MTRLFMQATRLRDVLSKIFSSKDHLSRSASIRYISSRDRLSRTISSLSTLSSKELRSRVTSSRCTSSQHTLPLLRSTYLRRTE